MAKGNSDSKLWAFLGIFLTVIGFIIVILDGMNNRLNFIDPQLLDDSLLYKPLLDISNSIRQYFAI